MSLYAKYSKRKKRQRRRPLGSTQREVLKTLRRNGYWSCIPGGGLTCGWVWDSLLGTLRIMESLVEMGLVLREVIEHAATDGKEHLRWPEHRYTPAPPDHAEHLRVLREQHAERLLEWGVPERMKVYCWTGYRSGKQTHEFAAARSKAEIIRTLKFHGLWHNVMLREIGETHNEYDCRLAGKVPNVILWRPLADEHKDRSRVKTNAGETIGDYSD